MDVPSVLCPVLLIDHTDGNMSRNGYTGMNCAVPEVPAPTTTRHSSRRTPSMRMDVKPASMAGPRLSS